MVNISQIDFDRKRPIVTAFNVSANISKLMSLLSSVTTSFPGMHSDAAGGSRWG